MAIVADPVRALGYHAHTLYLFTDDQIIDTVIPATAFGIMAAASGNVLDLPSQSTGAILARTPQVALWVWVVILQFCVQNQRSPSSVEEDRINKPWRPMPSNRITPTQVEHLLSAMHILAFLLSWRMGVLPIFAVYSVFITTYNNFGGGDHSGISRNTFCGAGFACYFSGAFSIALGPELSLSGRAWKWTILLTMGALASTFHVQEFRDEVGDRARGRRTLVTELGRRPALWSIIVLISFWSLYLPLVFFKVNWMAAMVPLVFGVCLLAIVTKAMVGQNYELDRRLYKLWSLWLFSLCPLPLFAFSST
jgi:4-hydroxybenzoate polyprenyltransferase